MRKPASVYGRAEKKEKTSAAWGRIHALAIIVFFAGAALLVRLFFVQVVQHERWTALAQGQHIASAELAADRGEVFIHDGENRYPVAINREYPTVYVVPRDVADDERLVSELSSILGVDQGFVREKLAKTDDPFEIIKKRLTEEEAKKVLNLEIKGVGLLPEKYRYYPAGELAAHVVGFASKEDGVTRGRYGVESSQNERLSGTAGKLHQEKDAAGRWIPLSDRDVIVPKNGDDLLLTIDRVIQFETERVLKEAVENHEADRATAIVMDPKTGAVLAMASQPQFDPNAYSAVEDYSLFLNPAVSLTYEPGSVMKPITMAIGIEAGKVSPNTEYVDAGVVSIGGYNIRNSEDKVYGRSSMYKVLNESINTGVIFVEQQVGNKAFKDYFERFGFGEQTGIEVPAELSGNTRNLDNLRSDIQYYTASFGQGITVTPLQLASAYSVLANGGKLMRPHILDAIIRTDGTEERIAPEEIRRVLSEETSKSISKMLRDVVVNGHGKRADVPGYQVGGKTGTAQVAKSDSKGYEDGLTIGSFAGYAPVDNPRFVIVVKIDNPKDVQWAESTAAPVFGRIMGFLLEYAKIEPTEERKK